MNKEKNITIENEILKYIDIEDYIKFVEFYYKWEITLSWLSYTYKENVLKFFTDKAKTKTEKKQKEKAFFQLIDIYNNYILNNKEAIMLTSFNDIFLEKFLKNTLKLTKVNFITKTLLNENWKNIEILFDNLIIIKSILSKYVENKEDNSNDFSYILNREEIDLLWDLILNIFYILKNINKTKLSVKQEFLLKQTINITLSFIDEEKDITEDNNSIIFLIINEPFALFDIVFYIELFDNIDKIISFNNKNNNKFLKDIYKKITIRIDYLKEKEKENEEDTWIKIKGKDWYNKMLKTIDNLWKKYNIKLEKGYSNYLWKVKKEEKKSKDKKSIEEKLIEIYNKYEDIKKNIKNKILWQDLIIDNIFDKHIKKLLLGFNKRPISLLFAGDSWLWKTELAKQIGLALGYKSLHVPMWNLKHKHTDATLLWSPSWYVGYDEKTAFEKYLIDTKEKNEIPVIIFDEIEKWHSSLQTMFLELFDEWKITFLNGNTYDLTKSIIIMTSNLGIEEINNTSIWFNVWEENEIEKENTNKNKILKQIQWFFRQEILNRISDIYIFNKLTKKDISKIIDNTIKEKINNLNLNTIINKLFSKKIDNIDFKKIKNKIAKIIKLDNIENIRIIESETEKIILEELEWIK